MHASDWLVSVGFCECVMPSARKRLIFTCSNVAVASSDRVMGARSTIRNVVLEGGDKEKHRWRWRK